MGGEQTGGPISSFGGGGREQRQDLSAFEKSNQAGGSKFSPI